MFTNSYILYFYVQTRCIQAGDIFGFSQRHLFVVSQYILLCIIQYNLNLSSKSGPGLYLSRDIIISCDLCWCLFIYALKLYSVPLHSFPFCFLFLVLLVYIPLWLISQVKYLFLGVCTNALSSISVFLYFSTPFQTRWELRVKLYQLNDYLYMTCIRQWSYQHLSGLSPFD